MFASGLNFNHRLYIETYVIHRFRQTGTQLLEQKNKCFLLVKSLKSYGAQPLFNHVLLFRFGTMRGSNLRRLAQHNKPEPEYTNFIPDNFTTGRRERDGSLPSTIQVNFYIFIN